MLIDSAYDCDHCGCEHTTTYQSWSDGGTYTYDKVVSCMKCGGLSFPAGPVTIPLPSVTLPIPNPARG
jgi:hypothetical protein